MENRSDFSVTVGRGTREEQKVMIRIIKGKKCFSVLIKLFHVPSTNAWYKLASLKRVLFVHHWNFLPPSPQVGVKKEKKSNILIQQSQWQTANVCYFVVENWNRKWK